MKSFVGSLLLLCSTLSFGADCRSFFNRMIVPIPTNKFMPVRISGHVMTNINAGGGTSTIVPLHVGAHYTVEQLANAVNSNRFYRDSTHPAHATNFSVGIIYTSKAAKPAKINFQIFNDGSLNVEYPGIFASKRMDNIQCYPGQGNGFLIKASVTNNVHNSIDTWNFIMTPEEIQEIILI